MKNALLMSLSIIVLSSSAVMAQDSKAKSTSMESPAKPMDMTKATNEAQYRTNLMSLGNMALMGSQIAQDKASNSKVKEFAAFEISEQKAIASVLKDMDTPESPMNAADQAILDTLKSMSDTAFDKAYLQASLDTHKKLENLTQNYLDTKAGNVAEKHAHHLAMVTLPTIKQHIAQSKELMGMLK